jgi:phosphatidate cytidylyltransferase
MFRKRLITAVCGVPVLVAAIWFDEPLPWFTILAAVWGLLAVLEFYRMTGVYRVAPLAVFGMLWTLLFILRPHCTYELVAHVLLISALIVSLVILLFLRNREGALLGWAWAIAGTLYVGWLLSFLVALRLEPGTAGFPEIGRNLVFLAIFASFGSDTFAYLVGKSIGRHRLAPRISPGKTWEGTAGGLFGAAVVTFLFTLSTPFQLPLNWWQAIILGLCISIFGQIGDLLESRVKRYAGVKESGNLMPGHGGILDRTDSILFAGVVVYIFSAFFIT